VEYGSLQVEASAAVEKASLASRRNDMTD